jgi:hypothetical protein
MSSVQEHYSTVADDNGEISGISIAEGSTQLRDLNDAIRQLMADVREESDELRARLSAIEAAIDPQGEEEEDTAQQAAATAQEAATLAGGLQDQVTDAAAAAQTANEAATEASTASAAALTALADYEDRIAAMEEAVAQFDTGLVQTVNDQVVEGVKTFSEALRADLMGNAETATLAERDAEGNVIAETYATKMLATTDEAGLMSAADKEKLDMLAAKDEEGQVVDLMQVVMDVTSQLVFGHKQNSSLPAAFGMVDENGNEVLFHAWGSMPSSEWVEVGEFTVTAGMEYVESFADMVAGASAWEDVSSMPKSMTFSAMPSFEPLPNEETPTIEYEPDGFIADGSVMRLRIEFVEADAETGESTYRASVIWEPSVDSVFVDGDQTTDIVLGLEKGNTSTIEKKLDVQPIIDMINALAVRTTALETAVTAILNSQIDDTVNGSEPSGGEGGSEEPTEPEGGKGGGE